MRDTHIMVSDEGEFSVDIKHLFENIVDHYSFSIEEAVIVENMDNCIDDPEYKEIEFIVKPGILVIIMRGSFIPTKTFKNVLPTIAATTKISEKGLGHYGWGMKVGLAVSTEIEIETRSNDFHGRQVWFLKEGKPYYRFEKPKFKLDKDTTIIVHHLNKEFSKKINEGQIIRTLQRFYPTLLAGAPVKGRRLIVKVNGQEVPPPKWLDKKLYKARYFPRGVRIEGESIGGCFFVSEKELEDDLKGIAIIVFGRNITALGREAFGLDVKQITGYVHADVLYDIVAGDKTIFKKRTKKWQIFYRTISKELTKFAKNQGLIKEERIWDKDFTRKVHKIINDILKEFPELQKIVIGSRARTCKVLIPKDSGGIPSDTELISAHRVKGTEKGLGEGGGVDVLGKGLERKVSIFDEEGIKRAVERIRRVKRGVEILYTASPNDKREAWYDPEGIIYMNISHPAYTKADNSGKRALELYVTRCALEAILDYLLLSGAMDANKYVTFKQEMMLIWGSY